MFREVTMVELKEVLRLSGKDLPKKRIAAQLGLDPKTVRRYLKAATAAVTSDPTSAAHPPSPVCSWAPTRRLVTPKQRTKNHAPQSGNAVRASAAMGMTMK